MIALRGLIPEGGQIPSENRGIEEVPFWLVTPNRFAGSAGEKG